MRVVLHAGFHKTGTTSLQQTMRQNRRVLSKYWRLFTRAGTEPLCEAARAFSIRREPLEEALLTHEWALFLATLDPEDPRPVVLSSEDLSGHMPGRHGLTRYDAAAPIMRSLAHALPDHVTLEICFSHRAPDGWIASCWAQNIRASALVQDLAAYRATMAPFTNLPNDIAAVRAAVAGRAIVHDWAIETTKDAPLGPITPLLDLTTFPAKPRARVIPVMAANPRLSDATLAELLRLNRSGLPKAALKAAKSAVIDAEKGNK